jgi:hypothetical protein
MLRIPARKRRLSRAGYVENLPNIGAVGNKFGASRLDVGYDEEQPLCGAGRGRSDSFAKVNRGR